MNQFEEIKSKIKEINAELVNYASTLEFNKICDFTLDNCTERIPWEDMKGHGVYFIEIKNQNHFSDFKSWVENFRLEWEDPLYKRRFVSNLKKNRIKNQNDKFEEWIPLYIGKSQNIKSRVWEHIYKKLDQNTFALKLNAREHAKKETFRLSIIKLPSNNYNIIMPVIESTLRKKLNPIIGRQ
ncbi:hypothetical protein DM790_22920 [Flavobacterium collinsii]|nr:hypothetical protein [Flavobacterium collinsii]